MILHQVDQPTLGMERKYFQKGFNDSDVQAYHKYQIDMAILLGANREMAEKDLKEALEFEMQLSNVSQRALYFSSFATCPRPSFDIASFSSILFSFLCRKKRGATFPNCSTR
jgi:hypothetical protein